jgi:predicted ATPase
MPALLGAAELEALQRTVQGTTRDRMLREFAELVEAVSAEQPLILTLEDLHWSDPSTLDLLTLVAQRREAAQLLVLGTYRPAEVIVSGHPLRAIKQELHAHRQCEELILGFLSEAAVGEYLVRRFAGNALPSQLAHVVYRRTEGNPLFMVTVVDDLVAQGLLREVRGQWQLQAALEEVTVGIPDSLRQLIDRQLERLPREEQRVLEVASIAGTSFSALTVAAGGEESIEQVEAHCERLVRRGQFLHASGTETVPDGTLTGRYGFLHALYQNVVYERVGAIRRIRLHRRIGEREEAAYGERAREVAAELAVHFERGHDYHRAVRYLQQAGENAIQRSAYQEAMSLLTKGLELLKILPDTPERTQQELGLQTTLSLALVFTKGFAAPEVETICHRMRELCQQVGGAPQRIAVLGGLWSLHVTRAEHQTALELAEQFFTLAPSVQHPLVSLAAHYNLGWSLLYTGRFALAREHQEQGIALYDPQQHHSLALRYTSFDYGIAFPSVEALTLWYLGYPEQALKRSHEGLSLARELAHPFSLAVALISAASFHQRRREGQAVQEQAEAVIALCSEQGFAFYLL